MTEASQRHPLAARVLAGTAPAPLLSAASRGVLPIPPEEVLEVLVFLRNHEDGNVRLTARETIASMNMEGQAELLAAYPFDADVFTFFAQAFKTRPAIVRALVRNPACPPSGLNMAVLQTKDPQVMDMVLTNQAKILQEPDILSSLLENPHCSMDLARRVLDLVEQFLRERVDLRMKSRQVMARISGAALPVEAPPLPAAPPPKPAPEPAPPAAGEAPEAPAGAEGGVEVDFEAGDEVPDFASDDRDLAQAFDQWGSVEDAAAAAAPIPEEVFQEEEVLTLRQQIMKMGVPEKVQLGLKGTKEARGVLIKDANKLVQVAVITSPKITDSEVDFIVKQRGINDAVLRKVAGNREWMKRYSVISGLVFNPRTPPGISLKLLTQMNLRDLKSLAKEKGVPEVIRRQAKKLLSGKPH